MRREKNELKSKDIAKANITKILKIEKIREVQKTKFDALCSFYCDEIDYGKTLTTIEITTSDFNKLVECFQKLEIDDKHFDEGEIYNDKNGDSEEKEKEREEDGVEEKKSVMRKKMHNSISMHLGTANAYFLRKQCWTQN